MTLIVFDKLKTWIQKSPDRAAVLFLVLFSCFFVFMNLGSSALIDWDESIYAAVSKEILESGDWLTLRWNKEIWFEKPPFYFWLTAATYIVFGFTEFAARFWSAALGVVGVVTVYFFGKEMFGRLAGFVSAMILASTPHWLLQSRNGTLDVMVASFIALTLYFFWRARGEPKFWKFSGIFLGLTFMTKNVVAVIPLLVMFIFATLEIFHERSLKKYPLKNLLFSCFLVFLFIVLPWHLAMYSIHGKDFIDEYFFYHVLARTKGIEGHAKPWFWYLIVLRHWARHWYLLFLGAIYLLGGLFARDGIRRHWKVFFLFLWFFITFVIFSASQSKIQWYLVPIYPVIALLVGGVVSLFFKYFGLRERILGVALLTIFCFISLSRLTHLWKIEDYNRDIAETAKAMVAVSGSEDRLLVYGVAQGPPIFYSGRKVMTSGLDNIFGTAAGGERFFALASDAVLEDIVEKGLDEGLTVFKKSGGYVLFGRE